MRLSCPVQSLSSSTSLLTSSLLRSSTSPPPNTRFTRFVIAFTANRPPVKRYLQPNTFAKVPSPSTSEVCSYSSTHFRYLKLLLSYTHTHYSVFFLQINQWFSCLWAYFTYLAYLAEFCINYKDRISHVKFDWVCYSNSQVIRIIINIRDRLMILSKTYNYLEHF